MDFCQFRFKVALVALDRKDLASFQSCSEANNMRLVLPLSLTFLFLCDDTKKRNPSSPLAQNGKADPQLARKVDYLI